MPRIFAILILVFSHSFLYFKGYNDSLFQTNQKHIDEVPKTNEEKNAEIASLKISSSEKKSTSDCPQQTNFSNTSPSFLHSKNKIHEDIVLGEEVFPSDNAETENDRTPANDEEDWQTYKNLIDSKAMERPHRDDEQMDPQ